MSTVSVEARMKSISSIKDVVTIIRPLSGTDEDERTRMIRELENARQESVEIAAKLRQNQVRADYARF